MWRNYQRPPRGRLRTYPLHHGIFTNEIGGGGGLQLILSSIEYNQSLVTVIVQQERGEMEYYKRSYVQPSTSTPKSERVVDKRHGTAASSCHNRRNQPQTQPCQAGSAQPTPAFPTDPNIVTAGPSKSTSMSERANRFLDQLPFDTRIYRHRIAVAVANNIVHCRALTAMLPVLLSKPGVTLY